MSERCVGSGGVVVMKWFFTCGGDLTRTILSHRFIFLNVFYLLFHSFVLSFRCSPVMRTRVVTFEMVCVRRFVV